MSCNPRTFIHGTKQESIDDEMPNPDEGMVVLSSPNLAIRTTEYYQINTNKQRGIMRRYQQIQTKKSKSNKTSSNTE